MQLRDGIPELDAIHDVMLIPEYDKETPVEDDGLFIEFGFLQPCIAPSLHKRQT